jgi:ssDNA-binding Zn-finger/Zn-ribbon topoisomerase 1
MFRYSKDGELTGELCPECGTKMYLVRLGSRQPMVRCPCGYEEKTSELAERIGWAESLRGQPKDC